MPAFLYVKEVIIIKPKVNDLVRVKDINIRKYKDIDFKEQTGVVVQVYCLRRVRTSFAVMFKGLENDKSSKGVFWFTDTQLEILSCLNDDQAAEFLLNINQIENNIEREEELEMGPMDRDCNRGCRSEGSRNEKVVHWHFDRKIDSIREERNTAIEEAYKADEGISNIKIAFEAAIEASRNKEEAKYAASKISFNAYASMATTEAIELINKDSSDKEVELRRKMNEVLVMLSGCSSYEDEVAVLIGYGIVEKNGAGIVMK